MSKLDLTVIILTFNEEMHIRRALENVCPIVRKVIVVDSPSTDRTAEICGEFENVEVVVHKYPGNQAEQFNWALDNCTIDTEWVLRLDADEYLTPELISEMQEKLPTMPENVSAVVLPLGRSFRGRLLRHSIVKGVKMVRLFRKGKVRYEKRVVDEHLELLEGESVTFSHMFVDDNQISIKDFIAKHNNYSSKEAVLLLNAEYGLYDDTSHNPEYAQAVAAKRAQKAMYARMPLYWRALGYFLYRYILKLGFLDGRAGFEWDFFQGLWYRMLVDAKVHEVRRICGNDREKIIAYIGKEWGIKI